MRIRDGSKVAKLYGASDISERHRHRYEVNRRTLTRWSRPASRSLDGALMVAWPR